MGKLIGYARVSTRAQDTDRQIVDLLTAGVRRDDLYTDHGVSGARTLRPAFGTALDALHEGDTLVVTTLHRQHAGAGHSATGAEDRSSRVESWRRGR